MAIYSKILELASGSARTIDLSTNTLSIGAVQMNGSTSGSLTQKAAGTTTTYTVTWPSAQGTTGQVLTDSDGAGTLTWTTPAGTGANTALSNLSGVAINASLLPGTDNSITLGSTSRSWASGNVHVLDDASGVSSVDVYNRLLYDGNDDVSIDFNNRYLKDNSGGLQVTWSTSGVQIGNPNVLAGLLAIANGSANFSTTIVSKATANYNFNLPTTAGSSGQVLTSGGGMASAMTWTTPTSGTVTSVAFADASTTPIYSVSGSPVTGTGTLTQTLLTQLANTVFAGPTTGGATQPTFRSLVSADIPSLSALYLALTGGTMSGAINMSSNKITNLANGTAAGDAVNYGQLTSISAGLVWQSPIQDPDLVNDSLSTPPGSPVYSLTYIIAASPTGAWSGLPGHAVWWDGAEWIDLSTGVTATSSSGTAVQNGARFLVAASSPQTYTFTIPSSSVTSGAVYSTNGYNFTVTATIVSSTTLTASSSGFPAASSGVLTLVSGTGPSTLAFSAYTSQVGGGLAGENYAVATVTSNTPGSFAYSFAAPVAQWALSDTTPGSQHYGDSFTYSSTQAAWINFAGPSKVTAGNALSYTGNTLNVQYDNSTIALNGSNKLYVPASGITSTQLASASVTSTQLASQAVTASAISTTAVDQKTIAGGNGTALNVVYAPSLQIVATYGGVILSANTTYALRWGLPANSETTGQLYLADWNTAPFDLYWIAGLYNSSTSTSSGTSITITNRGSITLKSSDTVFSSTDQGKAVWLGASGAYTANSTFAPATGDANMKLGIATSSTTIWVDPQLNGIS
jgi:hypothetical protein